jgi:hypothetical protein
MSAIGRHHESPIDDPVTFTADGGEVKSFRERTSGPAA